MKEIRIRLKITRKVIRKRVREEGSSEFHFLHHKHWKRQTSDVILVFYNRILSKTGDE